MTDGPKLFNRPVVMMVASDNGPISMLIYPTTVETVAALLSAAVLGLELENDND